MATVSVAFNGSRLDAVSGSSSLTNIGGGAGPVDEPDIRYQGTSDVSRKVGTAAGGYSVNTVGTNMTSGGTHQTYLAKFAMTNFAALELLSVPGVAIRVGSSATAYHSYNVHGSDTYPSKGGFIIIPIDPNIAGYRSGTTGSPNLSSVASFGLVGDFTATSKSENVVLSAIDIGDGLTLTGGDGGDADGVWADFADADYGTEANRWGFVVRLEGVAGLLGVFGMLTIGSATATVFTDSGVTLVFPDGLFDAGWSGVTVNLSSASSVFSSNGNTFDSRGNTTTTDTRAVLTITGTSGTATFTDDTIKNFAAVTLNSATTVSGGSIETADLTFGGASVTGTEFRPTAASGVAMCNDWDFTNGTDCSFVQAGSGHAIEITSPGTYTFDNLLFSGFGGTPGSNATSSSGANDAAIYNNSGGSVTINITNGGDTPSVRNGSGATTSVINAVPITLTNLVTGSRVYVYNSTDAAVISNVIEPTSTFSTSVSFVGTKSLLIRVRNASGSTKYKAYETTGTLTSTGFSLNVNQELDQ